MHTVLEQIRGAKTATPLEGAESDAIYRQLHALAEQQFIPARTFCETLLDGPDAEWRLIAIRCLFHYDLADSPALLTRLRRMLANDPDVDMRIWISGILGMQPPGAAAWPDGALVRALAEDPVVHIRANAFRGLLETAGIPYPQEQQAIQQMERGEIPATWAAIERIVAAAQGDTQTRG